MTGDGQPAEQLREADDGQADARCEGDHPRAGHLDAVTLGAQAAGDDVEAHARDQADDAQHDERLGPIGASRAVGMGALGPDRMLRAVDRTTDAGRQQQQADDLDDVVVTHMTPILRGAVGPQSYVRGTTNAPILA